MPVSQIVTNSIASGQTYTSPVFAGTPTGVGVLTSGTAVASTSGTSIDFTGIPSWVKRITVMFSGISSNGSNFFQLQLGTASSIETTGYNGTAGWYGGTNTSASTAMSSGFLVTAAGAAAFTGSGMAIITLLDPNSNLWVMQSTIGRYDSNFVHGAGGSKALAGVLTRVRFTTVGGTDTFDAGSINILYE